MPMARQTCLSNPDEVMLTREGDAAIIECADPRLTLTRFRLGRTPTARVGEVDILQSWSDDERHERPEPFVKEPEDEK